MHRLELQDLFIYFREEGTRGSWEVGWGREREREATDFLLSRELVSQSLGSTQGSIPGSRSCPQPKPESEPQPPEPHRNLMLIWTWSGSSLSPLWLSSSHSKPLNPTKASFLLPRSLPSSTLLSFIHALLCLQLTFDRKCLWRLFRSSYPFLPHPVISYQSLSGSGSGIGLSCHCPPQPPTHTNSVASSASCVPFSCSWSSKSSMWSAGKIP